jgi:hypothetical protein
MKLQIKLQTLLLGAGLLGLAGTVPVEAVPLSYIGAATSAALWMVGNKLYNEFGPKEDIMITRSETTKYILKEKTYINVEDKPGIFTGPYMTFHKPEGEKALKCEFKTQEELKRDCKGFKEITLDNGQWFKFDWSAESSQKTYYVMEDGNKHIIKENFVEKEKRKRTQEADKRTQLGMTAGAGYLGFLGTYDSTALLTYIHYRSAAAIGTVLKAPGALLLGSVIGAGLMYGANRGLTYLKEKYDLDLYPKKVSLGTIGTCAGYVLGTVAAGVILLSPFIIAHASS